MFDVDILKKDRPLVEEMLKKRGAEAPLDRILALDSDRLALVRKINSLREEGTASQTTARGEGVQGPAGQGAAYRV